MDGQFVIAPFDMLELRYLPGRRTIKEEHSIKEEEREGELHLMKKEKENKDKKKSQASWS